MRPGLMKMLAGEAVPFGLRAMKTVAMADGRFDERERRMMIAARDFLGAPELDVDALAPIAPDELAAAMPADADLRRQLVQGLIVLAMADEDPSPAEAAQVERFSKALGVEVHDLRNLQRLADGHAMIVRLDLIRRVWVRDKIQEMTKAQGLGWLARSLAAVAGIREDEEIAARYRAFESLPPGSLGRSYWEFIKSNGFSLPGEKGAAEPVLFHDLTHVLTGYDTTPDGELQIAFFHAGARRVDPFMLVFFAVMQFHLGIRTTPVAAGARGVFDPPKALAALARGSRCTIDPLAGWDFWPVVAEPVAALRERYAIGP